MILRSIVFVGCTTAACLAMAQNPSPKPTLGKLGKIRLEETFSTNKVPKNWRATFGDLAINGDSLAIRQLKKDKHAAAIRVALPIQDCVVSFEYILNESQFLHFGFDPAKGELDKKGHLYSVVIKPESLSLLLHHNKADPKSKPKILATQKIVSDPQKKMKLIIENKGQKVMVSLNDKMMLEAEHAEFAVRKPGLVFRVAGKESSAALIDNVKVWEYK